ARVTDEFAACAAPFSPPSEFVLDLGDRKIWLVQHRLRRAYELSPTEVESWAQRREHAIARTHNAQRAALSDPRFPAKTKDLLSSYSGPPRATARPTQPLSVRSTPEPSAQVVPELRELTQQVDAIRLLIDQRIPGGIAEVFRCALEVVRVPFTAAAPPLSTGL